jgi:hypothetical protein
MSELIEIEATLDKYGAAVFKQPCNLIIFGSCFSGKTYFCQQIIQHKNQFFHNPPDKIIVFYKEYQKIYDEMKKHFSENIEFIKGVSNDKLKYVKNAICVYDDCLSDISPEIIDNFYAGSQHRSLVNIFLSQSVYFGDNLKLIRRVSNYLVFLNTIESASIFRLMQNYLTKQQLQKFTTHFNDIMGMSDFNHLICDLHPRTKDIIRYKFNIWNKLDDSSIEEYQTVKIK